MSSANSGSVESEFGLPIPGEILPADQWARTALKKLPTTPFDWADLFGREAPVVLDLGCGNGRFTLGAALTHPECNYLAVDILPVVIRYATRRANQRGLHHTRWAVVGGMELLESFVPAHSVAEIHCYHPQPYYTRREIRKRLINPHFLSLAHQALLSSGTLFLQTDHPAYWNYMQSVVPAFFDFHEQAGPWPDQYPGRSRREILAQQHGLPIFRGWGTPRLDLCQATQVQLTKTLPWPTFNADRRLQKLDQLEMGRE